MSIDSAEHKNSTLGKEHKSIGISTDVEIEKFPDADGKVAIVEISPILEEVNGSAESLPIPDVLVSLGKMSAVPEITIPEDYEAVAYVDTKDVN